MTIQEAIGKGRHLRRDGWKWEEDRWIEPGYLSAFSLTENDIIANEWEVKPRKPKEFYLHMLSLEVYPKLPPLAVTQNYILLREVIE